jgi:hypothetical protein
MAALPRQLTPLQPVIQEFYPGYFAAVMATGILAVAFYQIAWTDVAAALFRAAQLAYLVCWTISIARAIWFLPQLRRDFTHHASSPGFLTMVAATCVLGSDYVVLRNDPATAMVLWIAAIVLWAALMYGFLGAVITMYSASICARASDGAALLARPLERLHRYRGPCVARCHDRLGAVSDHASRLSNLTRSAPKCDRSVGICPSPDTEPRSAQHRFLTSH